MNSTADDGTFTEQIVPFLNKHCLACHGEEKPKSGFRVDRLANDFDTVDGRRRWHLVLDRIQTGEMPPASRPRPDSGDVKSLREWSDQQIAAAVAKRTAEGRVVLRRLNRVEYENTLRDLLGISLDLKSQLPEDSPAHGFDNVGEALHTSSFLMEKYLDAADAALDVAIANRPQPKSTTKRIRLTESYVVARTTEDVYRKLDDGTVVCLTSSLWHNVVISPFYPSERGLYRFRVGAYAVESHGKALPFRITVNGAQLAGKNGLVGYFDAPADTPTVFEFTRHMEPRTTVSILPYGLDSANTIKKVGSKDWTGPGLAVQFVEVEGPIHDSWPPAGHRRLFGDLPLRPAPVRNQRDRLEVASDNPTADADRVLRGYARRAFRRAVTDADVKPITDFVAAKLSEGYSFEQAIRAGLLAILVSPDFLFLREKPGLLDDHALAARLSYFLWSTTPDDELLDLADAKKLSDPATLRVQVERMLDHPKAAAFAENFVGQWLGLRDIDFTEPSHLLYPEYDHMLKVAMLREAELFFEELLKNDLNVSNFLASDFSMLNGRLAKHYGIPGVDGWAFRKVALPPESHRGGLLTMAGVLKVTANGTSTSPVVRGAWVLDRLLGTPPSPPPEGVAGIVPDVRGAETIREQLAKHRSVESCAACHVKIDPPGFALESFDVIGGWRDRYRVTGNGESVVIDGRKMHYRLGKPVDPGDVLPDGTRFKNVDEFKTWLLTRQDQFTRALVSKLLTYATGGSPAPGDATAIDAIVARAQAKGSGFRTLVHEIVQSPAFRSK